MKRFTVIFLIFLCLSFSVIRSIPAFAAGNIFTQGIYKLSDFNISNTTIFTIQNISKTEGMYLYIIDENQVVMESLRLVPSIQKLDIIPIKPDYVILIVGKGEVYVTEK
ncbi:MAG: hypothetical protein ABRQ25_14315 [Clostridiaceae bacterium]